VSAPLLAVTGTDTGAGKTVVAAALTAALRRQGLRVGALKLIATGVPPGEPGGDAELLARAAGIAAPEAVLDTFALPRSPLAAAAADCRVIDVDALLARLRERVDRFASDVVVLEAVGGLLVPLSPTATVRDLLRRLDALVVIAARAGLGTINHCALTVEACRNAGLRILGVVMSDVEGVDPAFAAENAAQVQEQCDVPVLGVLPHVRDAGDVQALGDAATAGLDMPSLVAMLRSADAERAGQRERIIAADRAHVWHPFTQTSEWRDEEPLVIRAGQGSWLIDESGERYLDGIASLWANVHGHAHPVLDRALHEQAGRIAHCTFLGQTHEMGALLAAELAAAVPEGLARVFYSEAGAAALEVALRVALLTQRYRGQTQRTRFVSLEGGYHGDTAGAVSVGRSEPFHRGLDAILFDAIRVPPPQLAGEDASLSEMRSAFDRYGSTVAALVIEPRMQGAAGMWPHTDAWLRSAVDVARSAGALIVCDEVATGFGRTGDLFASAGAAVTPDILVLGKGITGGYLPLSATLVPEELFYLFTGPYEEHRTLYYGHTYAANPLACAVARASLQLFAKERTLDGVRRLTAHLEARLREVRALRFVSDVRQRGVMVGVELADDDGSAFDPRLRVGRQVTLAARRRRVVVRSLGDVVVLNPPLVMTETEADLLIDAVIEAVVEVGASLPARVPA
jgi:adenosylmethionine-8-amino-7-oxononanoate aminotransferase